MLLSLAILQPHTVVTTFDAVLNRESPPFCSPAALGRPQTFETFAQLKPNRNITKESHETAEEKQPIYHTHLRQIAGFQLASPNTILVHYQRARAPAPVAPTLHPLACHPRTLDACTAIHTGVPPTQTTRPHFTPIIISSHYYGSHGSSPNPKRWRTRDVIEKQRHLLS